MQRDEVVRQVINRGHYSYRIKTVSQNFCRNEYNVTCLCSRQSYPLANSQYATIKEENYGLLYVKTAGRTQKPKNYGKKSYYQKNYEQILKQLKYFRHQHKSMNNQNIGQVSWNKVKIMLLRIRMMRLKDFKELISIKKQAERRDKIREQKALIAANLESKIEQELIDRLKMVVGQNQVEDEAEREDYSQEQWIFDPQDFEDDVKDDDENDDKDDDEYEKVIKDCSTYTLSINQEDDIQQIYNLDKDELQYEEEIEDRKK